MANLIVSEKANKAIKSSKTAHFSMVALCFVLLVVSAFSEEEGYLDEAMEELEFLESLDDKTPAASIIREEADIRAGDIVPDDVNALVMSDYLFVEWQEGPELHHVRDRKTKEAELELAELGLGGTLGGVDLTDEVLENPKLFSHTQFEEYPYPNVASCIFLEDQAPYRVRVFNWDEESRNLDYFTRFSPTDPVGELLFKWDSLRRVKVWFPTEFLPGITVLEGFDSTKIVMPMRLMTEQANNTCDDYEVSVYGRLRARAVGERTLPSDVERAALLYVEGDLPQSGAMAGTALFGILFTDRTGNVMTPIFRVTLPLAVEEVTLDVQSLGLERNNKILPEGSMLGRSAESFPNLKRLIDGDAFLDGGSTAEEIRARVNEALALFSAETRTKLYGVDISIDKFGIVGLITLIALQAYFLIHLRYTAQVVSKEAYDESWIATQGNIFALTGIVVSATVLPAITGVSVAYSMVSTATELSSLLFATATAGALIALILGVLSSISLKRLFDITK